MTGAIHLRTTPGGRPVLYGTMARAV